MSQVQRESEFWSPEAAPVDVGRQQLGFGEGGACGGLAREERLVNHGPAQTRIHCTRQQSAAEERRVAAQPSSHNQGARRSSRRQGAAAWE